MQKGVYYDPIKVHLPKELKTLLDNDAKNFEVTMRTGRINRNELYSRIILNYREEFLEKLDKQQKKAKEIVSHSLKEETIALICRNILESVLNVYDTKGNDAAITIKPTSETHGYLCDDISVEKFCVSVGPFLRNMFLSYAMQSPEKRERIIFARNYKKIKEAIKENKNIKITIKVGNNYLPNIQTTPYELVSSKEELHLYLLSQGVEDKKIYTTRLMKIEHVEILQDGECYIDKNNIEIFEKMKKHGPQFRYEPGENGAIIELNDIGKARYNSIYIHRPEPCDVTDTNRYHFDCSHEQLFRYFSRFDEGFYVVEPESLRNRILEFHKKAIEKSAKLFSL